MVFLPRTTKTSKPPPTPPFDGSNRFTDRARYCKSPRAGLREKNRARRPASSRASSTACGSARTRRPLELASNPRIPEVSSSWTRIPIRSRQGAGEGLAAATAAQKVGCGVPTAAQKVGAASRQPRMEKRRATNAAAKGAPSLFAISLGYAAITAGELRRAIGHAVLLRWPSRLLASGRFRLASRPSRLIPHPARFLLMPNYVFLSLYQCQVAETDISSRGV